MAKEKNILSNNKKEALDLVSDSGIATIIRMVFSLPRKLLFALILGPVGFGLMSLFNMLLQYSNYFDLGLHYCLSRELPKSIGNADETRINQIITALFSWTIFNTLLFILIIFFWTQFNKYEMLTFSTLLFIFFSVIFSRINTYLNGIAKGFGEFNTLGKSKIFVSTASPLILLPMVFFFEIQGYLAGTAILYFCTFLFFSYYLSLNNKIYPRFKIVIKDWITYFKLGFTLWAVNTSRSFFWVINITIIALFFDADDIGIYAFAISTFAFTTASGGNINTTLSRQMFLKSSKESNLEYTAKYLETHFVTYLLAMSLSFGFFILLFNLLIDLFLSEFKNSLELMKVLFLGYLFYSTTTITSDVLNVGDKHLRRLTILLLGIAVNTILVFYLSIQNNYGLLGIAWSSTIGLFVLSLLFIFFAFELAGLNKFDIFVFILKNSFISVTLFLVITNLLDLEISTNYFLFLDSYHSSFSSYFNGFLIMLLKTSIYFSSVLFVYYFTYKKAQPLTALYDSLVYIMNKFLSKNPQIKS